MSAPAQSRWWLLALGVAGLAAGLMGLVQGVVEVPSTFALSGKIERDAQPGAYWLLTLSYLFAGGFFLYVVLADRFDLVPIREERPRPPAPGWARGLAWTGVAIGGLFLGAAAWFHFNMDPIVSLPFVLFSGAAGTFFALTGIGYLVTGRLH